jgi:hypothetical protein
LNGRDLGPDKYIKPEGKVMKRMIIIAAILSALLSTQTLAAAESEQASGSKAAPHAAMQQGKAQPSQARKVHAPRSSSPAVTYNRDSSDPHVGWHTVGGMRVCTQDCDNPEIPGSGYTCKNVQFLGMAMRECDSSSW